MHNNKLIENAKKYVNKLLLPLEDHYYHSYQHALDVMERAVYLGKKEGLNNDELEILALAGLFHDTGFIIQYDDNEPIGAKIANNFLRTKLHPKEKIKLIENIIMATMPSYTNPKNIYEKIIKDADMDNLGRDDFIEKSNNLKKEREIIKKIKITDPEWNHASVDLMKEYQFETITQKIERDNKKKENLKKMIDELENDKI